MDFLLCFVPWLLRRDVALDSSLAFYTLSTRDCLDEFDPICFSYGL